MKSNRNRRPHVLLIVIFVLVVLISVTQIKYATSQVSPDEPRVTESIKKDTVPKKDAQKTREKEDQRSGLGISTSGKLGVELAPGIILDFDGGISPGFGF